MERYRVNINGIEVNARYTDENVRDIFIPLLEKIAEIQREKSGRVLVFLAAPPGAGKSTLSSFLQDLSLRKGIIKDIQIIGMDGFHKRHDYLKTHTISRDGKEISMVDVKGAPETFDLEKLTERVRLVKAGEKCGWPVYDRLLHDAVDNVIAVESDVVILEGNYLLLKDAGWRELSEMADLTVFVKAEEQLLKKRLVERRIASGHDEEGSLQFVEYSDMYNARTVLNNSKPADIELAVLHDGRLVKTQI